MLYPLGPGALTHSIRNTGYLAVAPLLERVGLDMAWDLTPLASPLPLPRTDQ